MNYYELLQVTPSASTEVIKNAYKAMAKKYHPDLYQGSRAFAEEKMKLLNEAISILENDEKRREYNEENNFAVVFSKPKNDEFMKDIDDFINQSGGSSPRGSKKTAGYGDSYADGSIIYSEDESKTLFDYEEELEKVRSSGGKGKEKIGKWYYFVIAGLLIANIALIALIVGNFSTALLDSFLKKDEYEQSGAVGDDFDEDEYNDIEDYIEPETFAGEWNDGVIPANDIDAADTTRDYAATVPAGAETTVSETTAEKAALALPPTEPTTGKKLPAKQQPVTSAPATTEAPAKPPETETKSDNTGQNPNEIREPTAEEIVKPEEEPTAEGYRDEFSATEYAETTEPATDETAGTASEYDPGNGGGEENNAQ